MNHRGHDILMMSSLEEAYTQAVEKASASVVSIGSAKGMGGPAFRPWWRRGIGAGVILDGEGHVLTNHHVVDDAERLLVTFPDGTVQGGTVVGGDEETDVAVVRVGANGHRAAEFADSDAVKLGQPVLALGNPLGLSGGPTVTSGVVSSLSRTSHSYARTGPTWGTVGVQRESTTFCLNWHGTEERKIRDDNSLLQRRDPDV